MLTTIDLDDELIAKAQAYTGLEEKKRHLFAKRSRP
jgi:Arc/MetJ family transcription regulator